MPSALYQEIFGKGERVAERRAVADLCKVLGIPRTPEREAWVQGLDLPRLGELRAHLKQRRAWPDAAPRGAPRRTRRRTTLLRPAR